MAGFHNAPRFLWRVFETVDEYGREGRLVGIFTTELAAREAAKGRGYFGSEGKVELIDLRCLDVNILSYDEELRRKALAKLSDEEKELLKLK